MADPDCTLETLQIQYTKITYYSFKKAFPPPNSQDSLSLTSFHVFSNCTFPFFLPALTPALTFKLKLLVLEYGVLSKIVLSDWTLFVDYKGQFNEFSMIRIKVFHRMRDVFITDLEVVSWNV